MKILNSKPAIIKISTDDLQQISGCTWNCGNSPTDN